MSSFPWLRKGSKTSNGLKRVPIKSAPFTEFHIPSPPGPLSAITTLFLGGKISQISFCQWHQCTSLRSIYSTHCRILGGCSCRFSALKGKKSALCAQLSSWAMAENTLSLLLALWLPAGTFGFSIKAVSLQVFSLLCWFSTIPRFSGWSRLILSKLLSPTMAFQLRKWKK